MAHFQPQQHFDRGSLLLCGGNLPKELQTGISSPGFLKTWLERLLSPPLPEELERSKTKGEAGMNISSAEAAAASALKSTLGHG